MSGFKPLAGATLDLCALRPTMKILLKWAGQHVPVPVVHARAVRSSVYRYLGFCFPGSLALGSPLGANFFLLRAPFSPP